MIDLKFLRENPEVVKENIKKKFQDHKLPLVDEVIESTQRRVPHRQKQMSFVPIKTRFPSRLVH